MFYVMLMNFAFSDYLELVSREMYSYVLIRNYFGFSCGGVNKVKNNMLFISY